MFPKFPKLEPLCRYLDGLKERVDLQVLGYHLRELELEPEDIAEACLFSDDHYNRNKVAHGPWYDLFIICWKPGQASFIHDHTGSSCGFKVLTGTATETVFEKTGAMRNDLPVARAVDTHDFQAGAVCLAQDEAIHRVINLNHEKDLITLHVYSPPLDMHYYEEEVAEPVETISQV